MIDARVEAVLQGFLAAQDAGRAPDPREYISRYPELAAELAEYFAAVGRVEASARVIVLVIPPDFPVGVPWSQVLEPLALRAMSVVVKAVQPELGRTVALKFLRTDDRSVSQPLVAEARAAARLDHPGIVPIFDVGEHAGRPFLAMA